MNKDIKKFVQSLTVIPGVTVENSGAHLRVLKDGKYVSSLPSTPSDHRWKDNALSDLRKAGITPGVKLDTELRIKPGLLEEQLRDGIRSLAAHRGNRAEFARFSLEVAETLDIPAYKTEESAGASIDQFLRGGGLKPQSRLLLTETLRMWRARNASQLRAERVSPAATGATEKREEPPAAPEAPPAPAGSPVASRTVTVTLDLDRVNLLLERFGITLS